MTIIKTKLNINQRLNNTYKRQESINKNTRLRDFITNKYTK